MILSENNENVCEMLIYHRNWKNYCSFILYSHTTFVPRKRNINLNFLIMKKIVKLSTVLVVILLAISTYATGVKSSKKEKVSTKKMVTFAINDVNKAQVSIYDSNNKLLHTEHVYTLNLNPLKSSTKIVKKYDLNPLVDGVYYLVAESNTKVVKYEILVVNETATIMSDPYSEVYKTVAVK